MRTDRLSQRPGRGLSLQQHLLRISALPLFVGWLLAFLVFFFGTAVPLGTANCQVVRKV